MIPFELHRRLPLIRRPFYQRDRAIAERDELAETLRRTEQELQRVKDSTDRTHDLKRAYEAAVAQLEAAYPRDEAMALAVGGGDFDVIGAVEVGLLKHYGLQPNHHLIDVGCGSGRLAKPLSAFLAGKYSGFDLVPNLVSYARETVNRPDWRFDVIDHISIPEPDGCADMVCFFSVVTHLLHEQSYWYLEEASRVLRSGGKIVFSFLDFSEPSHWPMFEAMLEAEKKSSQGPLTVFIARDMIAVWARHLALEVETIVGAQDVIVPEGALGQALGVLRRP